MDDQAPVTQALRSGQNLAARSMGIYFRTICDGRAAVECSQCAVRGPLTLAGLCVLHPRTCFERRALASAERRHKQGIKHIPLGTRRRAIRAGAQRLARRSVVEFARYNQHTAPVPRAVIAQRAT